MYIDNVSRNAGVSGSDTSAETTATSSATAPLPDPVVALATSGDVGAELAALAVQSGEAQRRTAQDIRDSLEDYLDSQQNQQIEAMRAKARDAFGNAFVEGLGIAANGGFDMTAAFSCDADKSKWTAGGTLAQGCAKMGSAFFAQNMANDDADATGHANAADHARRTIDDMNDACKGADGYVNAAIEFYREYVSAQGQTMNAALHRA
jgi:hypothetical protein